MIKVTPQGQGHRLGGVCVIWILLVLPMNRYFDFWLTWLFTGLLAKLTPTRTCNQFKLICDFWMIFFFQANSSAKLTPTCTSDTMTFTGTSKYMFLEYRRMDDPDTSGFLMYAKQIRDPTTSQCAKIFYSFHVTLFLLFVVWTIHLWRYEDAKWWLTIETFLKTIEFIMRAKINL